MIVEISKRTTSAAQKLLRVSALVLIASHATAQNPVVKTVTTMDQLKNDFISAAAATNMANEMCNQVRPSKWSRAGAYILGGHTKINIDSTDYGDVRQKYFQNNATVTATQSHMQAPHCTDLGTISQDGETAMSFSRSKKAVISNSATTSFSNAISFDASVRMNIPGVDATVSSGFVQTSGTSSTAVSSSSDTSSTKLTKNGRPLMMENQVEYGFRWIGIS
jgi:LysM repeat protein